MTDESEQVPGKDGIYEDSGEGYEAATATVAEPSPAADSGESASDINRKYPALMREFKAQGFHKICVVDDHTVHTSGILWPQIQEAEKQAHITYFQAETEEPTTHKKVIVWEIEPTTKLKETMKAEQPAHRQARVNGRAVDLRNRANFDLVNAQIRDVENVVYSQLHELGTTSNKRVRRGVTLALQRTLLLRGPELSRDLYDTLNLRLRGQVGQVVDSALETLEQQAASRRDLPVERRDVAGESES